MTTAPAAPRRPFALALILAGTVVALSAAGAMPVAAGTPAATFTVNSTGDAGDDDTTDGVCDTGNTIMLPVVGTPECTLRAAIQQANADASTRDFIEFEIPGDGPHTIQPASALPQITTDLVIDGYTETGATPNTAEDGSNAVLMIELDGGSAGAGVAGLEVVLAADFGDVLIRGLAINNFGSYGIFTSSPGTAIEGNFIGTNVAGTEADGNGSWGVSIDGTGVVVGSGTAGRNVISGNANGGILASNGADSVIAGNLIGTNAAGTAALPNSNGIELSGTEFASVTGNVISGNEFHGVIISNFARANFVQGNLIGTDAAGGLAVPNGWVGIFLTDTTDNMVGGAEAGLGNVISGNGQSGVVLVLEQTEGNSIVGNLIGANAIGAPLGNGEDGVSAISSGQNWIGGTEPGAGNVIANNDRNGVTVGFVLMLSRFKSILGNSIHDNGGLGIDLDGNLDEDDNPGGDGVTPNDLDDVDDGPNELQNYPIIESATLTTEGLEVTGTLNSTASDEFRLEFFLSAPCDASGYGEGASFMGADAVTTDAGGDATFSFTFDVTFEPVEHAVITGTATNPGGNTSEFSECQELVDERLGPASPGPSGSDGTMTAPPSGGSPTPSRGPGASRVPDTANHGLTGLGGIGVWISGALVFGSLAALTAANRSRRGPNR